MPKAQQPMQCSADNLDVRSFAHFGKDCLGHSGRGLSGGRGEGNPQRCSVRRTPRQHGEQHHRHGTGLARARASGQQEHRTVEGSQNRAQLTIGGWTESILMPLRKEAIEHRVNRRR